MGRWIILGVMVMLWALAALAVLGAIESLVGCAGPQYDPLLANTVRTEIITH